MSLGCRGRTKASFLTSKADATWPHDSGRTVVTTYRSSGKCESSQNFAKFEMSSLNII